MTSGNRMRRRLPLRGAMILTLLSVLFAVAVIVGTRFTRPRAVAASPAPPTVAAPVRTVAARVAGSAVEVEKLSGTVEAKHTATVAAEVAARVLSRPVERGDRVAAGTLLAAFDDRAARAARDQARAALAQAVAARRQVEAEYERAAIESAAAIANARATVSQATAGERKARSFTRTQELRQAQATLDQAQTDERLATIERDRYQRLVAAGAVAQQVLDRTEATYEAAVARTRSAREGLSLAEEGARQEDIAQASAQVSAARAGLQSAQARPARLAALREQIAALRAQEAQSAAAIDSAAIALSKHRVAAPFDGRVLETRIERGEMVSPGVPLVTLADVRQVMAIFAVSEAARPRLRRGQIVPVRADALPGRSFSGRVAVIGYNADPKAKTFRVELVVDNPGEALLPNMTVRLALPLPTAGGAVTVPISAVATDTVTGEPYVVLASAGKTLARRTVTLGAPAPGDAVIVASGLHGGETLAADPARITLPAK